jgi:hypothetical protein
MVGNKIMKFQPTIEQFWHTMQSFEAIFDVQQPKAQKSTKISTKPNFLFD